MIVSMSTPIVTMMASCTRKRMGSTASAANVAASTIPADVMTPPVVMSPASTPLRWPAVTTSSRTRLMRKML